MCRFSHFLRLSEISENITCGNKEINVPEITLNSGLAVLISRKKTRGSGPKRLKILKNWLIFLFLNTCLCQSRYQKKTKTIRHATVNDALFDFYEIQYEPQIDYKKEDH